MATATEARRPDYAPLTQAGHNAETVLEVEGLQTYLFTRLGVVKAVDDRNAEAPAQPPISISQ